MCQPLQSLEVLNISNIRPNIYILKYNLASVRSLSYIKVPKSAVPMLHTEKAYLGIKHFVISDEASLWLHPAFLFVGVLCILLLITAVIFVILWRKSQQKSDTGAKDIYVRSVNNYYIIYQQARYVVSAYRCISVCVCAYVYCIMSQIAICLRK